VTKPRIPIPRAARPEDIDELTLLACLVWGEARGESSLGRTAVAWVVRNRVQHANASRFGKGWHGVILSPLQFSCFNAADPNSKKLLSPTTWGSEDVWAGCYQAAAGVYFRLAPDPTLGADHYHTGAVAPVWSRGRTPTIVIGSHRFFRLG
jgi:N-acetylmuramoyl-L-alanine amidase